MGLPHGSTVWISQADSEFGRRSQVGIPGDRDEFNKALKYRNIQNSNTFDEALA